MTYKTKKLTRFIVTKLIIGILVIIDIYPLFWMLTASFKTPDEFVSKPAYALNAGFYIQNYIDAWTRGKMAIFFKNSLFVRHLRNGRIGSSLCGYCPCFYMLKLTSDLDSKKDIL